MLHSETLRRFEYEKRESCVCGAPLRAPEDLSRVVTKKFSWGDVTFLKCEFCESWMQSSKISVDSISRWFDSPDYQEAGAKKEGVYVSYSKGEAGRLAEAHHRYNRELKSRLRPGSSILEIGCATGPNLHVLKLAGHRVKGIDFSAEFSKKARELYDVEVQVGDFRQLDPGEERFDMILLYGTFVNFLEPLHQLIHIRNLLKPDGIFCFNSPVADSWVARLYGKRLWMFTPSGSCFPSVEGCLKVLENAGLQVVEWGRDHQAPTVSKLMGLSGLKKLFPVADALGITSMAPPFPLPIPIVRKFWCRPMPQN